MHPPPSRRPCWHRACNPSGVIKERARHLVMLQLLHSPLLRNSHVRSLHPLQDRGPRRGRPHPRGLIQLRGQI